MDKQSMPGKEEASILLTAEWNYLVMLNFEIDPNILRLHVPPGTELHAWEAKTLISIVGFLFRKTRIFGIPVPYHYNFEQVNIRFYVRHKSNLGWRRGVVFIKQIVPRMAIALAARLLYNENYVALPMQHSVERNDETLNPNGSVEYRWRFQNDWNRLCVRTTGESKTLVEGTEAEFISDRYWGYAIQKDGSCIEYQIEHPPWRIWEVSEICFQCNVAEVYGEEFVSALSNKASSAFVAEGSPVLVRRGIRLP